MTPPDLDEESPTLDLRSGRTIWERVAPAPSAAAPLSENIRTDVVIVGSGITGSFIAERLTRSGRGVVVLDRNEPQSASTAASTALLQWEIDAPMLKLEERLGFDASAAVYRHSIRSVQGIAALVAHFGVNCGFAHRKSLYLAGTELDAGDLREELRLRARAGIDGAFLSAAELALRYGFQRDAALEHSGSAEADPVALARGLMSLALARGARLYSPAQVVAYDASTLSASVMTREGFSVEAELLVLANGYEMPPFVQADAGRISSTWALATKPQPRSALWPGGTLVWEASDPYFYMRSTPPHEIIIGGEDEPSADAESRDRQIPTKVEHLLRKLSALIPDARLDVETAWAGFFSETEDGLPLIGPVPGLPRCYSAFGYGGNGITFSALAASMITKFIANDRHPLAEIVAIDRSTRA
jgi:glycine/D-amino acid oxidase-like deaminating enzyme